MLKYALHGRHDMSNLLLSQHASMQAFKEHPDKPSQARCEELAEAWHDSYTPQAPDRCMR